MKIMITGGAGFIGSAVIRTAIERGHEIINVDKLTYAANLDNLKGWSEREEYAFEKVDICDDSALMRIFSVHQPDAVMHLAAESHVDRSIDGPGAFIQTNLIGTFEMLQAARRYFDTLSSKRKRQFRFHHVSTDEVYGSLGKEGLFSEDTPYAPNSPYSASKAGSDFLVRAWGKTYDLPVITSNCSNNYGPYQHPEKLIPVVILKALASDKIPVYGTGENIRDWLFVNDHADALLLILTRGTVGETYNVGGLNEKRNIDLVRIICRLMDTLRPQQEPHENLITFVVDRPGHDQRYAIDASKIEQELGWRPSVTIEEGIRHTVEWYLNNEWWWQAVHQRGFAGQRLGLNSE